MSLPPRIGPASLSIKILRDVILRQPINHRVKFTSHGRNTMPKISEWVYEFMLTHELNEVHLYLPSSTQFTTGVHALQRTARDLTDRQSRF